MVNSVALVSWIGMAARGPGGRGAGGAAGGGRLTAKNWDSLVAGEEERPQTAHHYVIYPANNTSNH